MKRAEKTAEEEGNRLVNNVGEKMQKDYQVDVAGFGNRLRIEHPRVWEKVKKIGTKHLVKFQSNTT